VSRPSAELLERMERREDLETRAKAASAEVDAARERMESLGGDSVKELEQIAASLEELTAGRRELATELEPELLELYCGIRRQKRGIGAAALVDGVCQACHETLSAMEVARL